MSYDIMFHMPGINFFNQTHFAILANGYKKNPFIDVFYHQSSERHPGHIARALPYTRGGRVRTGDQTTASPTP
jgi:hypothetical protein